MDARACSRAAVSARSSITTSKSPALTIWPSCASTCVSTPSIRERTTTLLIGFTVPTDSSTRGTSARLTGVTETGIRVSLVLFAGVLEEPRSTRTTGHNKSADSSAPAIHPWLLCGVIQGMYAVGNGGRGCLRSLDSKCVGSVLCAVDADVGASDPVTAGRKQVHNRACDFLRRCKSTERQL